jgi:hypothetical protein
MKDIMPMRALEVSLGGPYHGYEGSQITLVANVTHVPHEGSILFRWDTDGDGVWDTEWLEGVSEVYRTWQDDYEGRVAAQAAIGMNNSEDVVSDGSIVGRAWLGSVYSQAQSFVPRMDILEKVHVDVAISALTETPDAPICLHIRESLDSTDLTSVCLPPEGLPRAPPVVPGWVEFDFADITVQPERTYFMALTSSTNLWVYETHPSDDLYPDGVLYHNQSGGWYPVQLDLRFKTFGSGMLLSSIAYANVTVENRPPVANADGPFEGDEPHTVQFTGTFTDPGTLDTHTFQWDFDFDGITFNVDSTQQSPTHQWLDDFASHSRSSMTTEDGTWT